MHKHFKNKNQFRVQMTGTLSNKRIITRFIGISFFLEVVTQSLERRGRHLYYYGCSAAFLASVQEDDIGNIL